MGEGGCITGNSVYLHRTPVLDLSRRVCGWLITEYTLPWPTSTQIFAAPSWRPKDILAPLSPSAPALLGAMPPHHFLKQVTPAGPPLLCALSPSLWEEAARLLVSDLDSFGSSCLAGFGDGWTHTGCGRVLQPTTPFLTRSCLTVPPGRKFTVPSSVHVGKTKCLLFYAHRAHVLNG